MSSEKRRVKAVIDQGMLQQMQARVAGGDLRVLDGSESRDRAGAEAHEEGFAAPGEVALRPDSDRAATRRPGAKSVMSRTTLSVPKHVGEQARRLTLALSLSEGLEASLGATLLRALRMLEDDLRDRGVAVPDGPVKLRSGPRHS
jgi:hypothetical protein